jgi:hypothetical protein
MKHQANQKPSPAPGWAHLEEMRPARRYNQEDEPIGYERSTDRSVTTPYAQVSAHTYLIDGVCFRGFGQFLEVELKVRMLHIRETYGG